MIVYDLICEFDHEFEGWFKDNSEFVSQQASGMLTCPVCNSESVTRIPSASRINLGKGDKQLQSLKTIQQDLTALAKRVENYIDKNFEDVGTDFADEARKIYYGEASERNIRGEATLDQAQELVDEGIEVISLPATTEKDKLN